MSDKAHEPLHGKTVLITGAARRIGAVLARELHAAGASVVLHFHSSADAADELVRELNHARSESALAAQADLLDAAQLHALPGLATRTFGSLDVLINNASTFYPTPVGEITAQQWDDLMGTNLRAPLFLAQAAASALRLSEGLILNIADIHGMRPLSRHTVYSVAKAGLIMLTKSLARELGPQIRVNGIAPGPVLWPDGGIDHELQRKIVADTLLKRTGSPQDIARAALFFATQAPFVTGQILAVDGGRSVCW
ncbi:MAG: pteridine reductase [Sinobacteraceae bacterium]|nr:pteridine reductase [Nevskiaceae bacterium]